MHKRFELSIWIVSRSRVTFMVSWTSPFTFTLGSFDSQWTETVITSKVQSIIITIESLMHPNMLTSKEMLGFVCHSVTGYNNKTLLDKILTAHCVTASLPGGQICTVFARGEENNEMT